MISFRYLLPVASYLSVLALNAQAQQRPSVVPVTPPPATVAPSDILIRRDGTELAVRVEEVGPELVKYRRLDNLTGPLFSVYKTDLFMVRYANGSRDVFTSGQAPPTAPTSPAPVGIYTPPPVYPAPVPAPPPPPTPLTPEQQEEEKVFEHVAANGPRIGLTVIGNGKIKNRLADELGVSNVISQFGWQFESRLFQLPNGTAGLLEFVPLIGGLDQGAFLPSGSLVLGIRSRGGVEFGVGPNLSLAGAGLAIAAGTTIQGKYINVPLTVACVPSRDGFRSSFLIGFTYRQRNQRTY